jgi:hypothetical protein
VSNAIVPGCASIDECQGWAIKAEALAFYAKQMTKRCESRRIVFKAAPYQTFQCHLRMGTTCERQVRRREDWETPISSGVSIELEQLTAAANFPAVLSAIAHPTTPPFLWGPEMENCYDLWSGNEAAVSGGEAFELLPRPSPARLSATQRLNAHERVFNSLYEHARETSLSAIPRARGVEFGLQGGGRVISALSAPRGHLEGITRRPNPQAARRRRSSRADRPTPSVRLPV